MKKQELVAAYPEKVCSDGLLFGKFQRRNSRSDW